jgi:HK97 family phage major capsid protein
MSKQRIKELRDKNSAVLAAARSYLDEITDETPEGRAAELEASYDAAMADYQKREKEIERLEMLVAAEEREASAGEAETRSRRPHPGVPNANPSTGDAEAPSQRDAFRAFLQRGLGGMSEQERDVFSAVQRSASSDPEIRALATSPGAEGGYLIPQDMLPEIDKAMALFGPMMDDGLVRGLTTETGNTITAPTLDYTAVRGDLVAEEAAVTNDGSKDPAFGQKTLNAYLYNSGIVKISIQLLQDAYWSMEPLMNDLFGESLGRTCNAVLTNGDGTDKPNGIVNFASVGKTANAAAALTGDELIDFFHSINPAYRASPKFAWQFNDTTLSIIRKLKDGNQNYLWQEPNLRSGEPGTLLGKPYRINPDMDDVEAGAHPILLGDHSKYIVRKVGNVGIVPFNELFMGNLQKGFMAFRRIDGEGLNNAAIKKFAMAAL